MIQEKNPLIDLEFSPKSSMFKNLYDRTTESLYLLFDLILEAPIENMVFEVLIISLGYLQLIVFIFDPTVSNIYNLIIIQF